MIALAYDSHSGKEKSTKTNVTRRVPAHPVLAKILAAWKLSHWERIYGRAPTPDDLIVPTRTFQPRDKKDTQDAFLLDLAALQLRIQPARAATAEGTISGPGSSRPPRNTEPTATS